MHCEPACDRLAGPRAGSLKEGPCGSTFVEAFSCFIRSDHEDKGMDCVPQFGAFQTCLQAHPTHVEALMLDAEEAVPESSDNGPKPPEST